LFGSATLHRLNAGDALFQVGDEGDGCYRLDKGFLKVILTSPEGEERILAILTPGAVVGDLAMIDGLPRSASVAALTDCELRFVCRTAFEQSVSQNPEIYRYLVKVLAARLREADEIIATLAFLSVRVHALLELAKIIGVKTGSDRDPPPDQSKRPRCDGGSRPRECESGLERPSAEKDREQIVGFLSGRR
jgi:CRP/FNR family transcriptional regulator